jgi:hypothetical protein
MHHLRRWAVLALALGASACNGDGLTDDEREAYGAYVLTAVNDAPLPFALGRPCGERAERGYLELAEENRFYVEIDISKPGCPGEAERTWVGTGIWTVQGAAVRLVSDRGGERSVVFGSSPAPFDTGGLEASGAFEGEGLIGSTVTFRFDR